MKENYVFLSYSHKDVDRIMPLVQGLSEEHRVIYDTNIGAAREYNNEIAEMIDHATIVLAFLSENYVKSSYCIDEILYARGQEIPILLVYMEPMELSAGMKLRLGRFQAVDVQDRDCLVQICRINEVMACKKSKSLISAAEENRLVEAGKYQCLEDIPENVSLRDKAALWQAKDSSSLVVRPAVITDPESGLEKTLHLDLCEMGHVFIFGMPNSGKSTFVQSMLYAAIHDYTPAQLNVYVLDMNTYAYEPFARLPHVGAVVNDTAVRRIRYLIHHVEKMLEERRRLIKNGTIRQYNQMHGGALPQVWLVLDGLSAIWEELEEDAEQEKVLEQCILEGVRLGIYVIAIDHHPDSKFRRLMRGVKCRVFFMQNGRAELENVMDCHADEFKEPIPSKPGMAYLKYLDQVDAIRVLLPVNDENAYVRDQMIEKRCEDIRLQWSSDRAPGLEDVPDDLDVESFFAMGKVQNALQKKDFYPTGLFYEDGSVAGLDLKNRFLVLAQGKTLSESSLLLRVLEESAIRKDAIIYCIDRPGREGLRRNDGKIKYSASVDETCSVMNVDLVNEIKRRNQKRHEALRQGKDDNQIDEEMKASERPLFILIEDLEYFLKLIDGPDGHLIKGFFENLIQKGRGHHMYFVAGTAMRSKYDNVNPIFRAFLDEGYGAVIGGAPGKQTLLELNNHSYKVLSRELKRGEAFLAPGCDKGSFQIPY